MRLLALRLLLLPALSCSHPLPWVHMANVYVVSAFLRDNEVSIVMAVQEANLGTYACHLWSGDGAASTSPLAVRHVERNILPFLHYASAIGVCNSKAGAETASVSITFAGETPGADRVAVQPPAVLGERKPLAVCTSVIHTDGFAPTAVEWFEAQRAIGATKVFAYAFNPGPLIRPILRHYERSGFLQAFEWLIPRSILQNQTQRCLLPYYHRSIARGAYDSPPCTYHQDNYNTGMWGHSLALNDCVRRARDRFDWVAIIDMDEILVPQAAPTLHAVVEQFGKHASQVCFDGWAPCYTRDTGGPRLLWPTARGAAETQVKCVVNPLAAGIVYPHGILSGGSSVRVPLTAGFRLHDRTHDIHARDTVAVQLAHRLAGRFQGSTARLLDARCGAALMQPHPYEQWAQALDRAVNASYAELETSGALQLWREPPMLNLYGGAREPWEPWKGG
jgi:Glycosyltransferase family 92